MIKKNNKKKKKERKKTENPHTILTKCSELKIRTNKNRNDDRTREERTGEDLTRKNHRLKKKIIIIKYVCTATVCINRLWIMEYFCVRFLFLYFRFVFFFMSLVSLFRSIYAPFFSAGFNGPLTVFCFKYLSLWASRQNHVYLASRHSKNGSHIYINKYFARFRFVRLLLLSPV